VLRNKLISYWPVILLCAGGVAVPLLAAWSDLPAILSGYRHPPYPVRIELPPPPARVLYSLNSEVLPDQDAAATDGSAAATEQDQLAGVTGTDSGALQPPLAAGEAATGPGGLLSVNFDLADPAGSDRAVVDTRKNVRINGVEAGSAAIRVTSGSALFIARDDLRSLLTSSGHKDLAARVASSGAAFASFDEIRRLGFGLRYDPVTDRILVSS